MELTKFDTQKAQGAAALGMVMLHLFCRLDSLPYTPLFWVGDVPLIYYLGLFGDCCVPIYCFCSGYAHYLIADAQGPAYPRRLPDKALRFLLNYWIVVVLFSGIGLIFDRTGVVPGSWVDFWGNMLVVGMNYNGAWWFVITYLFLLGLSPMLAAMTKRINGFLILAGSIAVYFVAYLFRFVIQLDSNAVLSWLWTQIILLGTSQLGYFGGMVCRKYGIIGKLRVFLQSRNILRRGIIFMLPIAAFVGHCIMQSLFVAPFTAVAVLMGLFLVRLPGWIEKFFLLMGKHSTNIWLAHMFFYLNPFPGLVFSAKYPLLILAMILALYFAASTVIHAVYAPMCRAWSRMYHIKI